MAEQWQAVARRMIEGLGVEPGELIEVRDDSGRLDVLLEILLAIELAGATPLLELTPPVYMERLWREAPRDYLAHWDRHRQGWLNGVDRILSLASARPDFELVPEDAFQTWQEAAHRLTIIEEERRLPFLLAAIPTERGAGQLDLSLAALEGMLLPALAASARELQVDIERVIEVVTGAERLTIESGDGQVLHLFQGNRPWHSDDGLIDAADRARGAIVSNLPAGSIYTTVLEDKTEGKLWLARAGSAREVVLTFEGGRITRVEAASGSDKLMAVLNSHSGEARRVGHVGIGLNAYLHAPIGWTLVDEHVHGRLFVSLGENRYMGGENESSLNVDYDLGRATLRVGERVIVSEGMVVV